jgi:hypothetical protein
VTQGPTRPTIRVYTLVKRNGEEPFLFEIGEAISHGEGFRILLRAAPFSPDGYLQRMLTNEPNQNAI